MMNGDELTAAALAAADEIAAKLADVLTPEILNVIKPALTAAWIEGHIAGGDEPMEVLRQMYDEIVARLEETTEPVTVELFVDQAGEWRFRGIAKNGEIVFQGEGYKRRIDAYNEATKLFPAAVIRQEGTDAN